MSLEVAGLVESEDYVEKTSDETLTQALWQFHRVNQKPVFASEGESSRASGRLLGEKRGAPSVAGGWRANKDLRLRFFLNMTVLGEKEEGFPLVGEIDIFVLPSSKLLVSYRYQSRTAKRSLIFG